MTNIYKKAFKEVYTVLDYLEDESYNKIPKDVIATIEENMDKDYNFFIDESLPFNEQDLLEETKAILFNLYRDYIASTKVKEKILEYQRQELCIKEKMKKEKFDSNEIFRKYKNMNYNN